MNVYDFDNTIFDGDSSIKFIKYSFTKHPFKVILCLLKSMRNILVKEDKLGKIKSDIFDKYNNNTLEEILEKKLDWIFNYYNGRMDIKGHADFVMYYSRLLLKEVLTEEEYRKITRYDCFTKPSDVP